MEVDGEEPESPTNADPNASAGANANANDNVSHGQQPTPAQMEQWRKDLQSYIRVRNRLGATEDDKLFSRESEKGHGYSHGHSHGQKYSHGHSHILTNLLPRIFRKMDEVVHMRRQYSPGGGSSGGDGIHDQMMEQLVGTVLHAVLRLSAIVPKSMPKSSTSMRMNKDTDTNMNMHSDIKEDSSSHDDDVKMEEAAARHVKKRAKVDGNGDKDSKEDRDGDGDGHRNIVDQPPMPPSWMKALVPLINTVTSSESQHLLLLLIHLGMTFPRGCKNGQIRDTDKGAYDAYVQDVIPSLLQCIDRLYDRLFVPRRRNVGEPRNSHDTNVLGDMEYWMSCSWTLIDTIAMALEESHVYDVDFGDAASASSGSSGVSTCSKELGLGLVQDWERDDIPPPLPPSAKNQNRLNDVQHFKLDACPQLLELVNLNHGHGHGHVPHSCGWVDFVMDIILFRPKSSAAGLSRAGFSRMNVRFGDVHSNSNFELDNTIWAGLASQADFISMNRTQRFRGRWQEGQQESESRLHKPWNGVGYLNKLQYTMLRLAVDENDDRNDSLKGDGSGREVKKCALRPGAISDKALLLAILSSNSGDKYVRHYAKSVVEKTLGGAKRLKRQKEKWIMDSSPKSSLGLGLVCSLLILILGEAEAKPVLLENIGVKDLWEDILGAGYTYPTETHANGLSSSGLDEKGGDFVRRGLLRSNESSYLLEFIQEYFQPSEKNCRSSCDTDMGGIRLYVHLLTALEKQPSISILDVSMEQIRSQRTTFRYNDFHLALLQKAYIFMKNVNREDGLTLKICHEFLQSAIRAVRENVNARNDQDDNAARRVPVHALMNVNGHRNRNLWEEHRTVQRERMEKSTSIINNRKIAYQMIGDIARDYGTGLKIDETIMDKKAYGLAMTLFNCAASENDDRLQPSISLALDALFEYYEVFHNQCNVTVTNVDTQCQVAPLLLSLLCAASSCSYVSRLAVARWCRGFVAKMDREAAVHICEYLIDDLDMRVATEAKKTLRKIANFPGSASGTPCDQIAEGDTRLVGHDNSTNFLDTDDPNDLNIIQSDLDSKVSTVEAETSVPKFLAREVLTNCGFCTHKANKALLDNKLQCIEDCGMSKRFSDPSKVVDESLEISEMFTCEICYDDFMPVAGFAMACGHMFCRSCWESYLSAKLQDGPNSLLRVTCPDHKCSERMIPEDIALLDPDTAKKGHSIFLTNFINVHSSYRHCPGPGCHMVAHTMNHSQCNNDVTCTGCRTVFCFGCGAQPHQPAKCSDVQRWKLEFGDSSLLWIRQRSKPCPSCKVPIEKNFGCNHMHCTQCDTHFCWLCMELINTGTHSCNQVSSMDTNNEKIIHFFTSRYLAHHEEEEFSVTMHKETTDNIDAFAQKHPFLEEYQWEILMDAYQTLIAARSFLKHSYIFAWGHNHRRKDAAIEKDVLDPFSLHQATLELLTERLGRMAYQTSIRDLYNTEGLGVVRFFFRSMQFHAFSVRKYMQRIQSLEVVLIYSGEKCDS